MDKHRSYKGYDIDVIALTSGHRFVPQVKLTQHRNGRDVLTTRSPPSGIGYSDEEEALKTAMNIGIEAVDGCRIALDPTSVR